MRTAAKLFYFPGGVRIEAPESVSFIAALEREIPSLGRHFDRLGNHWRVYSPYVGKAERLAEQHYGRVIKFNTEHEPEETSEDRFYTHASGTFGKVPKPPYPGSDPPSGTRGNRDNIRFEFTHGSTFGTSGSRYAGYPNFTFEHTFNADEDGTPATLADFVKLYGIELGVIRYREHEDAKKRDEDRATAERRAEAQRQEQERVNRVYREARERDERERARREGPSAEQAGRFFYGRGGDYQRIFEDIFRQYGGQTFGTAPPAQDDYSLLGCKPGDSKETVQAAYRKLALGLHPDRNGSPDALERMQKVNAAWTALKKSNRW